MKVNCKVVEDNSTKNNVINDAFPVEQIPGLGEQERKSVSYFEHGGGKGEAVALEVD